MNNTMAINTYLSTITLHSTGSNATIKIYTVPEWITKQNPYICCLQETYFRLKDTHRLKDGKKIF